MGWFNEIINKIKDFFGKEEDKEIDLSPYEESQNKLNEQLKQIDEEYKAEHSNEDLYEDIEDLLPEKIEFEYREYTGDDEKTIKDKTEKKYDELLGSDTQSVSADYDGKIGQIEAEKDNAANESKLESEEVEREYAELEKQMRNSLVEKGLLRSSIGDSQSARAEQTKNEELGAIGANLENKLASYDADIEKLNSQKEAALNELNINYAQKLQKEIDTLLADRQKQIDEINKYNDNLKVKEAQYLEDRQLAIEKQIAQRAKDQLEIEKLEQQIGYAGEKAENYESRYQLAYDYYKDIPKDIALKLVEDNTDLQKYLGYYYTRLVASLQNKAG